MDDYKNTKQYDVVKSDSSLYENTNKENDNAPDIASDAAPDATSDAVSDTAPDTTPDAAPDTTSDAAPDTAPDTTSDAAPDAASDTASDTTSDAAPDTAPDTAPDAAPDITPDAAPDKTPDTASDAASDATSDTAPDIAQDATPDITSDAAPDAASDTTPDTASEQKPVHKMSALLKRLNSPAVYSVALILIVLVVSVFILMNYQGMSPSNFPEWIAGKILGYSRAGEYPVEVSNSYTSPNNFQLMDSSPVLLTQTSFLTYNKSGVELSNRQHNYSNPALCTSVSRALLYDIGGLGYRLESISGIDYEGETSQKILLGTISPNGVYALSTAGSGYASITTVYSREHKTLYTRSMHDLYTTALGLNSNGSSLAIGGLRSEDGSISSSLLLLNLKQEEPVAKFDFSDNIIVAVFFMNNGQLAVVGDRASYIIEKNYKSITTFDYKQRTLLNFSVDTNNGLTLALTGTNGKSCTLVLMTLRGQSTLEQEVQYSCSDINFTNKKIYLLSDNQIICYSDKLIEKNKYACPVIGKRFLKHGLSSYLLSSGYIWKVDTN